MFSMSGPPGVVGRLPWRRWSRPQASLVSPVGA